MGSCVGRRKNIVTNLNTKTFVLDNQLLDRFTGHQVEYLKSKFNSFATNSLLDRKSFLQLFPGLRSFPPQVIQKSFQIFSENTSSIKFRSFCVLLAQLLLSSKEDQSKFVFSLFDVDSDGKLNDLEIETFLKSQQEFLRKLSENIAENIRLHKEKINKIPVEKGDFVNWSLRNIELSDLLKPFELIPSASTEKQIISSKLMNNERLEEGEYVYLINNEWWLVWKNYVRFEPEHEDFEESTNEYALILPLNRGKMIQLGEKPVAIDNSPLFERDSTSRLKQGLRLRYDYIWVKKDVWELLYSWYGGGPVIQRKVLCEQNKLSIELYPFVFGVIPVDSQGNGVLAKKKTVSISKTVPVKDLLIMACQAHDKSFEFSRLNHKVGLNWIVCDTHKLVSFLSDGSELLLETAFIEKSVVVWPRENGKNKHELKINEILTLPNSSVVSNNSNRSMPEKNSLKSSNFIMPGISGLQNLGNTCFLNSVLQSILHTPMFSEFFTGDSLVSYINPAKTKEKNLLSLDLNLLAKEMASSKVSKVNPAKFYKNFTKKFPMFNGSEQHDCHECLSLILDSLHEELKRVGEDNINNNLVLENPVDKSFEKKEADEQWNSLQGNRGSLVTDVCGGQTRTTLSCEKCGNRKVLFEIFNNLSLPIPAKMQIPLNITVVLLSGKHIQIAVALSKFAKFSELMLETSKMVGVDKEKLFFAEYYSGSPLSIINRYENEPLLRLVRETSNLFAYEIVNSIEEGESYGKKVTKYVVQGPNYKPNSHVDVQFEESVWKSGKIIEAQGTNFVISLDYEDKTDVYKLSSIAPFRCFTKYEDPKILFYILYQQTIRNFRIENLGFPEIISIGNWYTYTDLYDLVKKTSMRHCNLKNNIENKEIFTIKVLDPSTLKCGICKTCDGCAMPRDKTELASVNLISIGVEWQDTYFHEEVLIHESVNQISKINFKEPIDISNCFSSFMNKEKIESKCEKCSHNELSMQVDIWRVPDILVLCLKRFAYQEGVFDKIDQPVSIPFYAFDISQWVKGVEISGGLTLSTTALQNAYDLYAIILHSGSIAGGHYTTLIKVKKDDDSMWILFDDMNLYVMKEDPDNINIAQNAYMLFYRRRKFSSSNVINLTYNFA